MLKCIGKDIVKYSFQLHTVKAVFHDLLRDLYFKCKALQINLIILIRQIFPDKLCQILFFPDQGKLRMLQLTVIIKSINHLCQILCFRENRFQILLFRLLVGESVGNCLCITLYDCDRCFQIVGNICQHPLLFHNQSLL